MKFALILILGVLPFTKADDGTCADHPKVDQIQDLIGSLEGEMDAADYGEIQAAFTSYKESDGDVAWTWDTSLGDNQCTGFGDGSASCCTDAFVKHFKTIFKGNVQKGKKEEKPTQKEFLKHFGMQLGKCKGKAAVETFLGLSGIQTFLSGIKQCRQEAFETGINFIRRNLCTLCFTGAEMTTKFENDKLKVTQASIDAYDTALQATFTCVEGLNSDLFSTVQTHYNSLEFLDDDTIACERFADWIYNLLEQGADTIKPTAPAAGACKDQAKMFGKGCEEDLEEGGFEAGGDKGPKGADGTGGVPGEGKPPKQPEGEGTKGEGTEGEGTKGEGTEGEGTKGEGTKGEEIESGPKEEIPIGTLRILTGDSEFTASVSGYEVYRDESSSLDGDIVTSAFTEEETIDLDISTIAIESDPTDEPAKTDDSNKLSIFISFIVFTLGTML